MAPRPVTAELTVACAWAELMDLEARKAPSWKRNAQRRHAKKVTRDWRLGREQAAQSREIDGGSTPAQVALAAE